MAYFHPDFWKLFREVHKPRIRAAFEIMAEGKKVTREEIDRRTEPRESPAE